MLMKQDKPADNLALFRLLAKGVNLNSWAGQRLRRDDINAFDKFVLNNGLTGLVYSAFKSPGFSNIFSADIEERYKNLYLIQWARNEMFARELLHLAEVFDNSGCEVIFLKGIILAQRLYADIGQRSIVDIDILVRPEDTQSTHDALIADGYCLRSKYILTKQISAGFAHHAIYRKADITLELHWALASHFSFKIDYPCLWQQKSKLNFFGRELYVLSHEYELTNQLLAIFTDIPIKTASFKQVLDLYNMLKRRNGIIKWDDFFSRRKKENIFRICLNILDLSLDIMDSYEEFPELAGYINKNRDYIKIRERGDKIRLLNKRTGILKSKLWAFSLYDAPVVRIWLWWMISLPFRLAAYRTKA